MEQTNLGIGTRLQHTLHGPGVIVGVRYATYLISFINHGIKEIEKTDTHLDDIIPENVTAEIETHSEVEKSLLKILRLWGGINENVPIRPRSQRKYRLMFFSTRSSCCVTGFVFLSKISIAIRYWVMRTR
jgi:hypothetical protein